MKISHVVRRSARLAIGMVTGVLATSSLLALVPSPSGGPDARRSDDGAAVVFVSRDEVRIRFAPDTASSWGWPAQPDSTHRARYYWFVTVDGADGAEYFSFVVRQRDATARSFGTLADLVREGEARVCQLGMLINDCRTNSALSSYVEDGRLVISLRDRASIVRMFGMRPRSAHVIVDGRGLDGGEASIRYVDPQLPLLDSAQRAEVMSSRRQWASDIYSRSRVIIDASQNGGLWVAVGDSLQLGIQELECLADVCGRFEAPRETPRTWGRWTLSDSAVASLHPTTNPQASDAFFYDSARVMVLVGVRPGRITVTASGVHTVADTMPSRTTVDTIVTRDVIVTP